LIKDADTVDVANFSIGGPSDNPWQDPGSLAWLSVRAAGIMVATSAGNSGPGFATVGSPADSPWMTSVANQTHDRFFFDAAVSATGPDTPPMNLEDLSALEGTGPDFAGVVAADIGFDAGNATAVPRTGHSLRTSLPARSR
jgi:hypothetical protein